MNNNNNEACVKVIGWSYTTTNTLSCFTYAEPTEAVKQAVINEIRENGYLFARNFSMSPILNTGEAVEIDYELHEELIRKAYGFSEEEYADYYERVSKEPSFDLTSQSNFIFEYPMRRIVWINDDAFDDFKASLLNGNSNVDIIPDDYIHLKKGDAVRYTSEDGSKYFEVKVVDFFANESLSEISGIKKMDRPTTENIFKLVCGNGKEVDLETLLYRYDGLSGNEIYNEFKRIYGTWTLETIFSPDFDCRINVIVFDKDCTFEPNVLKAPEDIPITEEVMQSIKEAYEESIREEKRKKEENAQKILKLKEKMAKRKKDGQ